MSRTPLLVAASLLLCLAPAAEAGKKSKTKEPPKTGWQTEEGWAGSCYYPPDFEALGVGDRRIAWQSTRDAMMQQWNGTKGDGVQLTEKHVINFETVLLAKPERIEEVSKENLDKCVGFMKGNVSLQQWESWLISKPAELTEGECPYAPLDYTLFDYLDINNGWQIPRNVCKGDVVKVHGTDGDYFKLDKESDWINVAGDTSKPTAGGFACNVEGCFKGQLIMRFTGDSGVSNVYAVGIEYVFTAPEHGKIEVMINDDNLSDNFWKVDSGLEHHTGIEYAGIGKD